MNIVEKMTSLLNTSLIANSPVLSGNMQHHIKVVSVGADKSELLIEAPFYDVNKYNETGEIIFTGAKRNGKTDYARDVNLYGGFFTGNKSKGWVNRVVVDIAYSIASEIGAEVINNLEE